MDVEKPSNWKNDLITKSWGKCSKSIRSISITLSKSKSYSSTTTRSPSLKHYLKKSFTIGTTTNIENNQNLETKKKKKMMKKRKACQVAPDGCFSVYVGHEKTRFVVRAEFANHPLFRMLLEDAESEYGYNSQGPISLPCDVDLFYKVLAEMESCDDHDYIHSDGEGFMMRRSSPGCSLISCSPLHSSNGYKLLSPSRLLKINNF